MSVHPRGCGEYTNAWPLYDYAIGSSPRVRGIRGKGQSLVALKAVHPRGCGEYGPQAWAGSLCSVHPRGCGEYDTSFAESRGWGGSSPRVRGIRVSWGESKNQGRFIPAGAGNTTGGREYGHNVGSSPRVRGILHRAIGYMQAYRFIPAGAGNTQRNALRRHRVSVHPRGCGEYRPAAAIAASKSGSSPRVRGIHPTHKLRRQLDRFIPAGAGNTGRHGKREVSPPVHPRGCGEYAWARGKGD